MVEKRHDFGSLFAKYELYQQKNGDNEPKLKFDSFSEYSTGKKDMLSSITISLEHLYINELHTKDELPLIEEIKDLMIEDPTKPYGKFYI